MSSVKEIDTENCVCYFFSGMINIKSLDRNKFKRDKKSYKNVPIYHISYVTSNNVKPFYFIVSKVNGYIDNIMGISDISSY